MSGIAARTSIRALRNSAFQSAGQAAPFSMPNVARAAYSASNASGFNLQSQRTFSTERAFHTISATTATNIHVPAAEAATEKNEVPVNKASKHQSGTKIGIPILPLLGMATIFTVSRVGPRSQDEEKKSLTEFYQNTEKRVKSYREKRGSKLEEWEKRTQTDAYK